MTQRIVDVTEDTPLSSGGAQDKGNLGVNTPELPPKFAGKSVEDIIEAYTNLEKEKGRLGNELGELRRVADKLITRDLDSQDRSAGTGTPKEDDEITDDDFMESPVDAVQKLVGKAMKGVNDKFDSSRREAALSALKQKHPDMLETVADEAFQDWVMESPGRQLLWGQASQGNFDIADELFNQFKATKSSETKSDDDASVEDTVQQLTQRATELEAATTVSRGSSTDSGERGRKNVFRRTDLIRLQLEDELKYLQMQPEIMAAYAEGRVV